jgi:pimeloyl-ACP methyl ester carboxylesterase
MTTVGAPETLRVDVGPTQLYLLKGGTGPACLVLHGIEGNEGWLTVHEALAASHTVYAPSHPGYGHTPAPEWVTSVQHQAIFYHWFLQQAGLDQVDLIGSGLGGWIAAEMAVMDSSRLRHLILVDPCGVRVQEAEMLDIFLLPWRQVIERGFVNGQQSPEYERIYANAPIQEFGGIREAGRTMTMRMCFKPYMHDPSLPGMLGKIRAPTLVVWGEDDQFVPLECAQLYTNAIPNARLEVLPECGHLAHLDQPRQLANLVHEFLSS